jgi:hypothetical protein
MFSSRVIRCLLLVAIAMVFATSAGSTAQASCGDYLMGHESHHLRSTGSNQVARPDSSSETPRPRRPCDGPGCQNVPIQPNAPAPFPVPAVDTQQTGCLAATLQLSLAKQNLPNAEHDERSRSGELRTIEHPPRT